MLKTDRMMERVKGRLIKEQVRIKKFEEKKQKLQNIKFSKSVNHKFNILRSKTLKIRNNHNIKEVLKKELIIGKHVIKFINFIRCCKQSWRL
jgi:hypothetical protein